MVKPLVLAGNIIYNRTDAGIYLLWRRDSQHYETPGGKVTCEDCGTQVMLSHAIDLEMLEQTARRELSEEVEGIEVKHMTYFGFADAQTSDGRSIRAHKFLTRITGEPVVRETERFCTERSGYIPLSLLPTKPLSPDLPLFLNRLEKKLQVTIY